MAARCTAPSAGPPLLDGVWGSGRDRCLPRVERLARAPEEIGCARVSMEAPIVWTRCGATEVARPCLVRREKPPIWPLEFCVLVQPCVYR